MKPTNRRGFTFIEILVVVTIIGVLATIGLVSYQAANKKSRDGKRKADIEQIRAALEMYRADSLTGVYPGSLASLTPTYIQTLPNPPANTTPCSGGYSDCYSGGGTTYTISINMESETSPYTKTQP